MLKAKSYNFAESNIALFGSDLEKNIKKNAAESDKAWEGAGKAPGLEIWRVKAFKLMKVPKEEHGTFYSGDSYIVLNTYKKGDALKWDVHFWIGKDSSQDEYGTAAYKTVEIDDILGGTPVQHREVQSFESTLFRGYFKDPPLMTLDGGFDSGFRHVEEKKYEPRLLWVKGKGKRVAVRQVPEMKASNVNSGDVFVVDLGRQLIQWNGKKAGAGEKGKAGQLVRALDDQRGSVDILVCEEGDEDCGKFFEHLEGGADDVGDHDPDSDEKQSDEKVLMQLSDESGTLSFTEKAKGANIKRDQLNSDDVFIFDVGAEIFVWIGKGASGDEKKNAMQYATTYLKDSGRPVYLPVTRLLEGGENEVFESYFG